MRARSRAVLERLGLDPVTGDDLDAAGDNPARLGRDYGRGAGARRRRELEERIAGMNESTE